MASDEGFEPPNRSSRFLVFKTSAINQTLPIRHICGRHRPCCRSGLLYNSPQSNQTVLCSLRVHTEGSLLPTNKPYEWLARLKHREGDCAAFGRGRRTLLFVMVPFALPTVNLRSINNRTSLVSAYLYSLVLVICSTVGEFLIYFAIFIYRFATSHILRTQCVIGGSLMRVKSMSTRC